MLATGMLNGNDQCRRRRVLRSTMVSALRGQDLPASLMEDGRHNSQIWVSQLQGVYLSQVYLSEPRLWKSVIRLQTFLILPKAWQLASMLPLVFLPVLAVVPVGLYLQAKLASIHNSNPTPKVLFYLIIEGIYNIFFHPLRYYPGPLLAKANRLNWTYHSWNGDIVNRITELHEKYGEVVRVAPNELSYISAQAWQGEQSHLFSLSDAVSNKYVYRHCRSPNVERARQPS